MNQSWIKLLPRFIRIKLEGRTNLQKIIGNTSWLFADRIIRMGFGLFVGVWVARYLGPEQYGLYNYALAFVALFSALSTLGLDSIVVRDLVREPSAKEEILGTAFILKLIGGIVTWLIVTGAIFLLRPDDPLTRWIVAIVAAGMIFQAFDTIDYWFQSKVQAQYTVVARNLAFLVSSLIKVLLIKLKAPLLAFAYTGLADSFLCALNLLIIYKFQGNFVMGWRSELSKTIQMLKDSLPLIFSSLLIMVYMRIDQIMLGEIIGSEEVGIYSVAVRFSELWYFLPTIVVNSSFPAIIEIKGKSEDIYIKSIQKLYNLVTWMGISIAIPMTFFSSSIIEVTFGIEYKMASTILAISIWSSIFVFQGVSRGYWLITENLQRYSSLYVAIGAIVNIILNGLLIPQFKGEGAAFATLFSQFTVAIIAPAIFKKTRISSKMLLKSYVLGK